MNLQFAFLSLREAQDKTEWKLIRRNLMFSTERPGILCVLSLESYLGKPLNVLYEIKKKKNPTTTKKLFCLYNAHGIVTQERFHAMCFLSSMPGPSLHSTGHCYRAIPYRVIPTPLWKEHMYLILNCDFPFKWSVTDLPSPLLSPFVFTDSLLFWYSFYCHFHHWNCSEGKVPIFSTITCSQAF